MKQCNIFFANANRRFTFAPLFSTGYSTVRLVCLLWEQEVAGSNPATPTTQACHSLTGFFYCGRNPFFVYLFDV